MSEINNDLWLFDYNQGAAYEAFSKCQDVFRVIETHLQNNFDFKEKVILEIGAGSGKFTPFLAKQCSKLYVVERSASLMQINRDKNIHAINTEFILSDVKDLAMKPNSIDVIFAGWSLTSMREYFGIILESFRKFLRKDGIILLVENAGNDEFCKIMNLEEFTSIMKNVYVDMGFTQRKVVSTTIKLPCKNVFYDAFPNKKEAMLPSLEIQHKVLILEMQSSVLFQKITCNHKEEG
ncbi:MAG: class I SAM-dependent methyltransferase [Candidatus Moranbacteria bacterium]|nr:class I SAM-dependent methyltransferase [Candidatus Moranbacteria bacterium]